MNFLDRCASDVMLSTLSTFGIGGKARWLFRAERREDIQEALAFVGQTGCPYIVVGRGSNCLFSDEGFSGLVIYNRIETFRDLGDGRFEVGGGGSFPSLGLQTASRGWSGLEFAAGIPGSVGGAVFMNAASHQQQTQDALAWVDYVDERGTLIRLTKEELAFGYRYSSLQKAKGAIVEVGFVLRADRGAVVRQQEMLAYRKKTQPYRDRSAGCVFRNPPLASAGRLIEEAGLKGAKIGGAEVSHIHANFIVNRHQATARDVLALMNHVRDTVADKHGVRLESEIRCISPAPEGRG